MLLLTLTLPHDYGQPLADLIATVGEAFTALVSGRAWHADKRTFGLAHWVRAHDITIGPNGWHPHLHVVLLSLEALTPQQMEQLEERLYLRWLRVTTNRGSRPPSREHGIRLEQARSLTDTSRYVCQVVVGDDARPTAIALELTRGDLKSSSHQGHRTPWQLLADFAGTGSMTDLALWREFEKATHGVQAIRWSNGLRSELATGEEATDAEIVEAIVGGEVVYTFSMSEWRVLSRTRGARSTVLRHAEHGGAVEVQRFMNGLCTRVLHRELTH